LYLLIAFGILTFLASLFLTPLVRDVALSFGIVDHPDQKRKLHSRPIPRVGGIAIFLSYLLPFSAIQLGLIHVDFTTLHGPRWGGVLAAATLVFLTGLLDDLIQLRPWQKLAGQFVAAGVAYWSGVHIPGFHGQPLASWLSLALSIIWLVGCTNAFNLIDGLDGLAAGVGLFATITILIAALIQRDMGLVIVTIPLAGCLLGFLRYNFNPASIFLGDSGSLSIGFFLGCCGVLWGQKSATLLGITAPLMALTIPLLEVLLSMARRFLRSQPIFSADRRHIHHLLLDRGLTPRKVALLIYGTCAIAAVFSLLQNAFSDRFNGLILVLFAAAVWIGIQHLGYSEFGLATRFFVKGTFSHIIDVEVRLEQLERALAAAGDLDQYWQVLRQGGRDFGFAGVRLNVRGQSLDTLGEAGARGRWQLRISLADSQYVNLYQDFGREMPPTALAGFARVLENSLTARFAKPEPALRRMAMRAETPALAYAVQES
jgi:UDP-GlcNAc:undecaprenyl-phosphate/decaprenyl-phosphate GlcNAc-1-phosphate transferase